MNSIRFFFQIFFLIIERYLSLKMRASAQLLTNEHQLMWLHYSGTYVWNVCRND